MFFVGVSSNILTDNLTFLNDILMELFDEIRPYNDDEVQKVLQKLLQDKEFIDALAVFNAPALFKIFRPFTRLIIKAVLSKKFRGMESVEEFQSLIRPYMARMIQRTTASVTWQGLDKLDTEKSFLFLSNHRDIALDPAFINYGLHQGGRDTARIAIGDNLLGKTYVNDLMRLNKSFIVKRSLSSRKDKVASLKKLSAYISHSIKTGHSVWLAHREGRAKDGNDFTEPAILKMLSFNYREASLHNMLDTLNIVPVAVSYEIDPCDFMKAKELWQRENTDNYVKAANEDLNSMTFSIQNQKGHVHIACGDIIPTDISSIEDCSHEVDRQIHQLYQLYGINYAACEKLCQQKEAGYDFAENGRNQLSTEQLNRGHALLEERLKLCDEPGKIWLLKLYANPVKNKFAKKASEAERNS